MGNVQVQKKHSILGLLALFEAYEAHGGDLDQLLNRHHLNLDNLSGSALIDQELGLRVIAEAIKFIDDPLLGLKVGKQITFTSYGSLALLIMSAPTVLEACRASTQFHRLSLSFFMASLHLEADYLELRFTMPTPEPAIRYFLADREFMATVLFVHEIMDDSKRRSIRFGVARPRPEPELLAQYCKIAGLEPEFNQPNNWLHIPAHVLRHRPKHGNPLAYKLYRLQAQEIMRSLYPSSDDLVAQIQLALNGYEGRYPDVKEVARIFAISERTLRRKLDTAGVSYRNLLDQHRKERALSMLVSRSASIQQMAEALGYAEDASFLRAFKRWTGLTPRQYLGTISST